MVKIKEFWEGEAQIYDEAIKKDLIAQVKAIRAYSYFRMGFLYGVCATVEEADFG